MPTTAPSATATHDPSGSCERKWLSRARCRATTAGVTSATVSPSDRSCSSKARVCTSRAASTSSASSRRTVTCTGPSYRRGRMAVMRVVVAPDSYGGTLTAVEAAAAIRAGWLTAAPHDEGGVLPLSDGGPGFVDVLGASLGGDRHDHVVRGPLGTPVTATTLLVDDTVYVEAAQAIGLHLLAPPELDPGRASSYGLGQLVGAVAATSRRVVVGLG